MGFNVNKNDIMGVEKKNTGGVTRALEGHFHVIPKGERGA